MKDISIASFSILFQFAQMRARVDAVTIGRQSAPPILENDFNVRNALEKAQERVLGARNISLACIMQTQQTLFHTGDIEIDHLVESVPKMFQQYVSGGFPTLNQSEIQTSTESDSDLLTKCARIFARNVANDKSKIGEEEDTVLFRNNIAIRLNESDEFRKALFLSVLNAQQTLRNTL